MRGRRKAWFDDDLDDPVDFLTDHVFAINRDYQGRRVHTVGFKLLLTRRTTPDLERLLRIREAFPSLAILHIRRENYLNSLISREFAERGKQWIAWSHRQALRSDINAFSIPLERARQHFEDSKGVDCLIEETFAGPGYRAIFYEDLVEHRDPVMASVFDFLKVSQCDVSPVTDKQVSEEDLALVRNLAQLRSEYEVFRITTSMPRRRNAVGVEVPPYKSGVSSELSRVNSEVLRKVLVLASRDVRQTAMAQRLEASGCEVDLAQIDRICCLAGRDNARWLSRSLPEGLAAVYLLSAEKTAEHETKGGSLVQPVLGVGVSAAGKRLVLGAWAHESAIDLEARGMRRTLIAVGRQDTLDRVGIEADTRLASVLETIQVRLQGLFGEELRAHAAHLAHEILEDQSLGPLPTAFWRALMPVARLEHIRRSFAMTASTRSWFTVEQLETRLQFFARSLDPLARDDTPWRPWTEGYTDIATRELSQPIGIAQPSARTR